MCWYSCMCMCLCKCMCAYRGQRLTSAIFPQSISTLFWGQDFASTPELTDLARPGGQQALSGIHLSLPAHRKGWDFRYALLHSTFYVGPGKPNSGPWDFIASTYRSQSPCFKKKKKKPLVVEYRIMDLICQGKSAWSHRSNSGHAHYGAYEICFKGEDCHTHLQSPKTWIFHQQEKVHTDGWNQSVDGESNPALPS